MQIAVMATAERDRELIADFESDCAGLGKAQMMRIGGLSAANDARASLAADLKQGTEWPAPEKGGAILPAKRMTPPSKQPRRMPPNGL